jgi:hypothetical protein
VELVTLALTVGSTPTFCVYIKFSTPISPPYVRSEEDGDSIKVEIDCMLRFCGTLNALPVCEPLTKPVILLLLTALTVIVGVATN